MTLEWPRLPCRELKGGVNTLCSTFPFMILEHVIYANLYCRNFLQDVLKYLSNMPNQFRAYEVPYPKWNHLDYMWARCLKNFFMALDI